MPLQRWEIQGRHDWKFIELVQAKTPNMLSRLLDWFTNSFPPLFTGLTYYNLAWIKGFWLDTRRWYYDFFNVQYAYISAVIRSTSHINIVLTWIPVPLARTNSYLSYRRAQIGIFYRGQLTSKKRKEIAFFVRSKATQNIICVRLPYIKAHRNPLEYQ